MGLLAQEGAFAAGPGIVDTAASVAAMPADCMEMMQENQPEPARAPCHGLTLDCIATMGCVIPLAVPAAPDPFDIRPDLAAAHYPPFLNSMPGLSTAPEPEPPIVLI